MTKTNPVPSSRRARATIPTSASAGHRPHRKSIDVTEFRSWLETLDVGVTPSIHINGYGYPAIMAVDFGSPLKPVKLTYDQNQELLERIRKTTREVVGREANVRVQHDQSAGIFWSSLA